SRAIVLVAIDVLLSDLLLTNIAFVVDPDAHLLTALLPASPPHTILILLEGADIDKALLLKTRFCLALGEAIRALRGHRRVCVRRGDSLVAITRSGRLVRRAVVSRSRRLRCRHSHGQAGCSNTQSECFHHVLLKEHG